MIKFIIRLLFYSTMIIFKLWWLLALIVVLDIGTLIIRAIADARDKTQ